MFGRRHTMRYFERLSNNIAQDERAEEEAKKKLQAAKKVKLEQIKLSTDDTKQELKQRFDNYTTLVDKAIKACASDNLTDSEIADIIAVCQHSDQNVVDIFKNKHPFTVACLKENPEIVLLRLLIAHGIFDLNWTSIFKENTAIYKYLSTTAKQLEYEGKSKNNQTNLDDFIKLTFVDKSSAYGHKISYLLQASKFIKALNNTYIDNSNIDKNTFKIEVTDFHKFSNGQTCLIGTAFPKEHKVITSCCTAKIIMEGKEFPLNILGQDIISRRLITDKNEQTILRTEDNLDHILKYVGKKTILIAGYYP